MIRLALKLAVAGAALVALWNYVPIGGRPLAERWREAGSITELAERAVAEVTGDAAETRPPPRSQGRRPGPAGERPTEGHTDADRKAIERIVAEQLSRTR